MPAGAVSAAAAPTRGRSSQLAATAAASVALATVCLVAGLQPVAAVVRTPPALADGSEWVLLAAYDASESDEWPLMPKGNSKTDALVPATVASPSDPTAAAYADLSKLALLRSTDTATPCSVELVLKWPGLSGAAGLDYNRWRQSADPSLVQPLGDAAHATGYRMPGFAFIAGGFASGFGGLALSSAPGTLLAGVGSGDVPDDVGEVPAWHVVGATLDTPRDAAWDGNTTFGGPTGHSATQVELWGRVPDGTAASLDRRATGVAVTTVRSRSVELSWTAPAADGGGTPVSGYTVRADTLALVKDFNDATAPDAAVLDTPGGALTPSGAPGRCPGGSAVVDDSSPYLGPLDSWVAAAPTDAAIASVSADANAGFLTITAAPGASLPADGTRGQAPTLLSSASPPMDSDFVLQTHVAADAATLASNAAGALAAGTGGGIALHSRNQGRPVATVGLEASGVAGAWRLALTQQTGSPLQLYSLALPSGVSSVWLRAERDGNLGRFSFSWQEAPNATVLLSGGGDSEPDSDAWVVLAEVSDWALDAGGPTHVGLYAANGNTVAGDASSAAGAFVFDSFSLLPTGCAASHTFVAGDYDATPRRNVTGMADGAPYVLSLTATAPAADPSVWPPAVVATVAASHVSAGLPVTEGLHLHLSAAGLSETNKIDGWPDLSGKGNTPTQFSITRQPRVVANAAGVHPAVRFSGGQVLASYGEGLEPGLGNIDVYVMLRFHSLSTPMYFISKGNYFWDFGWSCLSYGYGPIGCRATDEFNLRVGTVTSSFSDTENPHVWSWTINRNHLGWGEQDGWTDGSTAGWFDHDYFYSLGSVASKRPLVIGGDDIAPVSAFNGDMFEVMIYDRRLDDDERAAVIDYMQSKYTVTCADLVRPDTPYKSGVCTDVQSGETCELRCASGLKQVAGDAERTCSYGTWSGEPLVCKASCPVLAVPKDVGQCIQRVVVEDFTGGPEALDATWARAPPTPASEPQWESAVLSGVAGAGDAVAIASPGSVDPCAGGASLLYMANTWWSQSKRTTVRASVAFVPFAVPVVNPPALDEGPVAALAFRVIDAHNYYSLQLDRGSGTVSLMVTVDGDTSPVGGGACVVEAGLADHVWYDATVTTGGDNDAAGLTLHVAVATRDDTGGAAAVHVACSVADVSLPFGGVGLLAAGGGPRFANVTVEQSCDSVCSGVEGSQCEWGCLPGYVFRGDMPRQCGLHTPEEWSGSQGNCTLVPPEFGDGAYTVDEGSPANTPVGSPLNVTSAASDSVILFRIVEDGGNVGDAFKVGLCDGQLRVNNPILDFETRPGYYITVSASLDDVAEATSRRTIYIEVLDTNDPPVLHPEPLAVPENSPVGTPVGAPLNVTDVDTASGGFRFRLFPGFDGDAAFGVDEDTGQVFVKLAVLNFEVKSAYSLLAEVADKDQPDAADSAFLAVTVLDANDKPVVQPGQLMQVDESEAASKLGSEVGFAAATDEDEGDSLAFSIDGSVATSGAAGLLVDPNATYFAIDAATGRVTMADHILYDTDYTANPPFIVNSKAVRGIWVLTVRASDGEASSAADITVMILANATFIPHLTPTIHTMAAVGVGVGEVPTRGGTPVQFVGTGLGPAGVPVSATYSRASGGTVFNAATCSSHLAEGAAEAAIAAGKNPDDVEPMITCTTVQGWGSDLLWSLSVNGAPALSAVPLVMSYAPPVVTSVVTVRADGVNKLATAGGTRVRLTGSNFGPSNAPVVIRYGADPDNLDHAAVVRFVAHAILEAEAQAGVGRNLRWEVSVDGVSNLSPAYAVLSYEAPVLTAIVPYVDANDEGAVPADLGALRTAGGQRLQLEGRGFGPFGYSPEVTFAAAATPALVYTASCEKVSGETADSVLVCTTPAGVGRGMRWTVSAGGQSSPASAVTTSYDAPVVTGVTGAGAFNANTEGGQEVLVHGVGFGPFTTNPLAGLLVTYGPPATGASEYTASACSVSVFDTQLRCISSPGTGAGHSWKVAVGGQSSAAFAANSSYAAPVVSIIERAATPGVLATDLDTAGDELVTINGANFGAQSAKIDSVVYGSGSGGAEELAAASCVIAEPHAAIECRTAAGAGRNLVWRVTIDGQKSTNPTSAYGKPEVHAISPSDGLDPSGGERVFIDGVNLGTDEYLGLVTYGPGGTEFVARECLVWVAHTQITCKTQPGSGRDHAWVVNVGQQASTEVVTTSYASPEIVELHLVNPDTGAANAIGDCCSTSGGQTVLVVGRFLGPLSLLAFELTDTEGAVKRLAAASYVGSAIPDNGGDDSLEYFAFTVPAGQGLGVSLRIVAGTDPRYLTSSNSVTLDYRAPAIERVVVERLDAPDWSDAIRAQFGNITTNSVSLRHLFIYGVNFGLPAKSAALGAVGSNKLNVVYVSGSDLGPESPPSSHVECFLTLYQHRAVECVTDVQGGTAWVSVGGRVSNDFNFFVLSPVLGLEGVPPLTPTQAPTRGGIPITISGSGMGASQADVNVTVGGRDCPIVSFTLHPTEEDGASDPASIVCLVPPGAGRAQEVVVSRRGVPAQPLYLDYNAPSFTTMSPNVGNTDGSTEITLTGSNLGETATVIFGNTLIPVSVDDHETITFTAPEAAGGGTGVRVLVRVGGQLSVEFREFSYAAPSLDFDTRASEAFVGGTVGGAAFTLTGANFARGDGGVVTVGGRAAVCAPETWTHTSIACVAPPGEGAQQDIVVTIGGQTTPDSAAFTYFAPTVTAVTPVAAPSAGGRVDLSAVIAVLDAQAAAEVARLSSGEAALLTPRQRDNIELQNSVELADAFDAAVAGGVTPTTIMVTGANFGVAAPAVVFARGDDVAYAGLEGFSLEWNHTHALFELPPGWGTGWKVRIAAPAPPSVMAEAAAALAAASGGGGGVGGGGGGGAGSAAFVGDDSHVQFSDDEVYFDYDRPTLLELQPRAGPTDACDDRNEYGECTLPASATFWGQSLGTSPIRAFPLVADASGGNDNGGGDGGDDAGGDDSDAGRVRRLQTRLAAAARGRARALTGADDGAGTIEILYDGRVLPGANILSSSHFHVTFQLPQGVGANHSLALRVGSQTSSVSFPFAFDPPLVTAVTPRPYDASGERLVIEGRNFGVNPSAVEVVIGGVPCDESVWRKDVTSGGQPYLTCDAPRDVVGVKNASVEVALQRTVLPSDVAVPFFYSMCMRGEYGQQGEFCTPCPEGAVCPGGIADVLVLDDSAANCTVADCPIRFVQPHALETWWELAINTTTHAAEAALRCDAGVLGRDACPVFVPCDPGYACLSNNTCAPGYEGYASSCAARREGLDNSCTTDADCNGGAGSEDVLCNSGTPEFCSSCVKTPLIVGGREQLVGTCTCAPAERCALCTAGTHFRDAGECVECPENAWLLIVIFVAAVLCVCIAGYILNRKAVNMAFLSIGVDYFQILAIFRRSKVSWPPELLDLFKVFSVFNFNLDITAPECAFPDMDYSAKWGMIQSLPLAAVFVFLCIHFGKAAHKYFVKGRRREINRHIHTLVSTALVTFYYIYLYLLRVQLEVFNCQPTTPPDGHTYTEFVSPNCGGLCRCDEEGGVQQALFPWAVTCFFAYSIGFPVVVWYLLFSNRLQVQSDQIMRAHEVPFTRAALGSDIFTLRKRLHKLYYHFKPQYWFWILLIIARKFLVAFTALMFRRNPSFQMAVALLVMFAAFVLQVKHRPYMSMVEMETVVEAHRTLVARGDDKNALLIEDIIKRRATGAARRKMRVSRIRGQQKDAGPRDQARLMAVNSQQYFWDYNTVESVLLGCAVLVNLAGIMFESGQFESDHAIYEGQRRFVTWGTILVIAASVIYFLLVFFTEVVQTVSPRTAFKMREQQEAIIREWGFAGHNIKRVTNAVMAAHAFHIKRRLPGHTEPPHDPEHPEHIDTRPELGAKTPMTPGMTPGGGSGSDDEGRLPKVRQGVGGDSKRARESRRMHHEAKLERAQRQKVKQRNAHLDLVSAMLRSQAGGGGGDAGGGHTPREDATSGSGLSRKRSSFMGRVFGGRGGHGADDGPPPEITANPLQRVGSAPPATGEGDEADDRRRKRVSQIRSDAAGAGADGRYNPMAIADRGGGGSPAGGSEADDRRRKRVSQIRSDAVGAGADGHYNPLEAAMRVRGDGGSGGGATPSSDATAAENARRSRVAGIRRESVQAAHRSDQSDGGRHNPLAAAKDARAPARSSGGGGGGGDSPTAGGERRRPSSLVLSSKAHRALSSGVAPRTAAEAHELEAAVDAERARKRDEQMSEMRRESAERAGPSRRRSTVTRREFAAAPGGVGGRGAGGSGGGGGGGVEAAAAERATPRSGGIQLGPGARGRGRRTREGGRRASM